ncbi:MAG: hypothetical protein KGQ60_18810 [Planctomycetes bacterium]|nr:hypothetical protein [Planctomycetota bacterium]
MDVDRLVSTAEVLINRLYGTFFDLCLFVRGDAKASWIRPAIRIRASCSFIRQPRTFINFSKEFFMSTKGALPPFDMEFEFLCSAQEALLLWWSLFVGTAIA